ncbi:beta-ketoacyl-[acyl-carrier-protein] synthase family protein [Curvibacter sp. CHRR-16]|uniref:beta-ketoacyl-[acyl-carrier-protein] synthase family protein n=1 Tax=Curvibacter sp. CHRR-16 TaxID=2835872 RepID=UPI001BDA2F23|nr:beta-ketoacyl-[acyl-carrier-protein] synthase family protein [Curvibacter sp. CHRR-16]MBT0568755.1 beta-ketoacyl-[acyl-carrier-protein] synthase family protein [Curvibacter sp. CHRR-16]
MSSQAYYLPALGMVNALGADVAAIAQRLFAVDAASHSPAAQTQMVQESGWLPQGLARVGKVQAALPAIEPRMAHWASRTNQLLLAAAQQIDTVVQQVLRNHGAHRVAVLVGSSNSGVEEASQAVAQAGVGQVLGAHYHYAQQELGTPALLLAQHWGLQGPAYSISTACTSSAKVFAAGVRLLDAGLCDAVVLGGADGLARMTVSGFSALESTSTDLTNPMSAHRAGINIGEGAALFVLSKQPAAVQLLGVGESSDAHHISAPHPQGRGAEQAMRAALQQAGLSPEEVDYLNLHGTATPKNDSMEAQAVARVFAHGVAASSTKPLTGHLLGAAGATEVGLCWLALQAGRLPVHVWDGCPDTELPVLDLVQAGRSFSRQQGRVCMSNSFAFGGNNASVLIGDAR